MSEYLQLRRIGKVFQRKKEEIVVLDEMNLTVKEKEFICLMGPTGCGKSTLLKIIGGIEKPSVGEIELKGNVYRDGIPKEQLKSFGFVFQNHNLLEWRTTEDNLKLPLEIFHLKGDQWTARIDEMLVLVGLQDYRRVFPHELSGGMKQRVGIARAMVHDPEILIMDHPFGALDAITRRMLAVETLAIWQQTQKTMIMVTNSVEEALLLSQRVVMLDRKGRIIEDVENTIPVEERGEGLMLQPEYIRLREHLDSIVHASNE